MFPSILPEPIPRPAPFAFALHLAAVDEALDFGVPAVVGEAGGGEQGVFAVPAGMLAEVVEQVGGRLGFGWLEYVLLGFTKHICLRFRAGRGGFGGALGGGGFAGFLVVQTLGDFLGVSLVVEFQQAVEDFAAGGFADGVAGALLGGVEAVI